MLLQMMPWLSFCPHGADLGPRLTTLQLVVVLDGWPCVDSFPTFGGAEPE
jgi:hypothetical protein